MGRGRRGGKQSPAGMVESGEKKLDYSKVGASFSKLPADLKDSISRNLVISETMKSDIMAGRKNKITDEWTTGFGKNKIKIITDVKDGKLSYSVKKRNKFLKRGITKEQAANAVARFYLDAMGKR